MGTQANSDQLKITLSHSQHYLSPLLFAAKFHHPLNNIVPKGVNHQISHVINKLRENDIKLFSRQCFQSLLQSPTHKLIRSQRQNATPKIVEPSEAPFIKTKPQNIETITT
ncbi:hypothetical protein V8G54_005922 [Vigna mungo]|uniref:Uncharacterized protein n=1 Tax=Vigna mungo TaxID=3915 RepID=A0AAQ3NYZ5_VIGMU